MGESSYRTARLTLVAAMLGALAVSACSPARVVEAAMVLGDLVAGAGPSRLKRSTAAPHRVAVSYEVAGRGYRGDVYRPGDGAVAALVLMPGATPAGPDDPRLVAFATMLARARFLVLVPDITNLRALEVRSGDVRHVADAVRYLASCAGAGAIGLVGISYAAGPALIAALENDIRDRIGFVLTVGGYYDGVAMLTYLTTGYFRDRPDEPWRHRPPNAYGKWVSLRSYAAHLRDAADRGLLVEMAARKLRSPDADLGALAAGLGAEGLAVYALVANRDPERVPGLVRALPRAVQREMAALDPKQYGLDGLAATLIIIHGRDDPIIPHTEARALAAAAPPGRAQLYLVDSLAHVKLSPAGLIDTLVLWRAVYLILERRDAAPPPDRAPARRHSGTCWRRDGGGAKR